MKFTVTLKDPDGVDNSLQEAVRGYCETLPESIKTAVGDVRIEKLAQFIRPWVDCVEYVTLEFDTEAGTCEVAVTCAIVTVQQK